MRLLPGWYFGGEPTKAAIDSFRGRSESIKLADYPAQGVSVNALDGRQIQSFEEAWVPKGFRVNHGRTVVANGVEAYDAVAQAIQSGELFQLGWCRFFVPDVSKDLNKLPPIVVAQSPLPFFWILMASKVLYVQKTKRRLAVGWGTSDGHLLVGEEVVSIDYDGRGTGEVSLQITSFSKPRGLLATLSKPYILFMQHRFVQSTFNSARRIAKFAQT